MLSLSPPRGTLAATVIPDDANTRTRPANVRLVRGTSRRPEEEITR